MEGKIIGGLYNVYTYNNKISKNVKDNHQTGMQWCKLSSCHKNVHVARRSFSRKKLGGSECDLHRFGSSLVVIGGATIREQYLKAIIFPC